MNCHNCKNSLKGDEDFCPRCGAPQRFTDADSGKNEPKDQPIPPVKESSIFHSEPVYIYTDTAPKDTPRKKPKFTIALVSIFIITVLGIGALSLGRYMNLTPVFSELFPTQNVTTTTSVAGESDTVIGMLLPDINLRTQAYTVTYEKGLPLRKGPDNAYATVASLPYGTDLQLVGKNADNDLWVYVYVSAEDLYGWVRASYITDSALLTRVHTDSEETQSK